LTLKVQRHLFRTGVGNLWPTGQMRPAWKFYMTRNRLGVTQVRAQQLIKKKTYLDSNSEVTLPHS